jgi:hypothetical protein
MAMMILTQVGVVLLKLEALWSVLAVLINEKSNCDY